MLDRPYEKLQYALKVECRARIRWAGEFPIDMLRYDRCFPATEEDAQRIQGSGYGDWEPAEEREVVVITHEPGAPDANRAWTVDRWASFGNVECTPLYWRGWDWRP